MQRSNGSVDQHPILGAPSGNYFPHGRLECHLIVQQIDKRLVVPDWVILPMHAGKPDSDLLEVSSC